MADSIFTRHMDKFNGSNYQIWKFQLKAILVACGIDDVVDGTRVKPEEIDLEALKTWKKDDAKAMFLISSAMDPAHIESILTCKASREMWTKLALIHEQKSETNKLILVQRFHEYRMASNDSMMQHVSKVQNMASQLSDVGEAVSDVAIMAKILASLPPRFNALKTAWDSVEPQRQTLENLQERLLKEETRTMADDDAISAFATTSKKINESKNQKSKKDIECFFCHQRGHFAWQCREKKRKKAEKRKTQSKDCAFVITNMAEKGERCEQIERFDNMDTRDAWLLDSGASKHISFRREWFDDFSASSGKCVMLGDDGACEVRGSGSIRIRKFVNNQWSIATINNVLYVPKLRKNLFSVGTCASRGYDVIFSESRVAISKANNIVAEGAKQANEIYRMFFIVLRDGSQREAEANVSESEVDLKLWHERFGHVANATLDKMISKRLISGIIGVKVDDFFCEPCQYGKAHRLPFQKQAKRKQWKVGECFHSDVCGPMSVESLGGARYFILFVDDASGYRVAYFVRSKGQVFEKYREFATMIKTKFERSMKVIRSDNGREYVNADLQAYLTKEGIAITNSAQYTPEQNGKPERANRTIVEAARTMLQAKNLPTFLWAEAVNTAVYLQNRIVSRSHPEKTPFEFWNEEKPRVEHLRVFGSAAYTHIPKQFRKKFVKKICQKKIAKSRKLIMVGYQGSSSNYRVYDPTTRKVSVSRDIVFNERDEVNTTTPKCLEDEFVLPCSGKTSETMNNGNNDAELWIDAEEGMPGHHEGNGEESSERREQPKKPRTPYQLRDRSNLKAIEKFQANLAEYPIISYDEAINGPESTHWKQAIEEELESHQKNSTWEFVPRKPDMKPIDSKWVFKILRDGEGNAMRYKARLCVRGFRQVQGVDYGEIFSPVIRYDSLRVFLALATQLDLDLLQFDIKTAFLCGELQEEIFMEVPQGIRDDQKDANSVCRLTKSWYGLKQAARCWNTKFTLALEELGLEQCASEKCIFRGIMNGEEVFLAIFVDDGLIASKSLQALEIVKDALSESFELKLGDSACFVGVNIERDRVNKKMLIHQQTYASKIVSKFRMENANPVCVPADPNQILRATVDERMINHVPYREVVGSLMFLAVVSRPDIAYAVNSVSKYLERHDESHWNAVKRIVKYIAGSLDFGIVYEAKDSEFVLTGFTDSDFASDIDTRRPTSGFVFFLCGGAVSWCCQRQKAVTLSTTEAEYVAAALATREAIWLRKILHDLSRHQSAPTPLFIDNQSAIRLVKKPEFHKRTKHVDVKFHFIREKFEKGEIIAEFVSSNEQCADIFTKAFPRVRFYYLRDRLGMQEKHKFV